MPLCVDSDMVTQPLLSMCWPASGVAAFIGEHLIPNQGVDLHNAVGAHRGREGLGLRPCSKGIPQAKQI